MGLKERVLKGDLADPFARRFSIAAWDAALEKDNSESDRILYNCMTVFHRYADAVMQRLFSSAYKLDAKATVLQRLLMLSTMTALELYNAFNQEARQTGYWNIARPPRFRSDEDGDLAADDANSIVIDALKLPVGDILAKVRLAEADRDAPIEEIDADSQLIIELAAAWHALKLIWEKCLLFDLAASELEDKIQISGTKSSYFVIGKTRQQHITTLGFLSRNQTGRQKKSHHQAFSRDGVDLRYKPSKDYEPLLDAFMLDDFTAQAILPSKIPGCSQATYRDVAMTFELLSDIAESCLVRLRIDNYLNRTLDQLCLFSRASLREAIIGTLNLRPQVADEALSALTYRKNSRFEPWATPVLPANETELVLLPGVLCLANRSYALEMLLKEQNYDMDTRGPAFEEFIHSALTEAISKCPYRAIVRLLPQAIQLERDGEREEVDLMLGIGKDLFVFEAKCTLFPTEPRDEYAFLRKIREAENQLARKIGFVRKHLTVLRELHPETEKLLATPQSVQGVIITNFHGGPVEGVQFPVADSSSLVHYFKVGRSVMGTTLSKGELTSDPGLIAPYYASFESFRLNFPKYVWEAPHLQPFSIFGQAKPITLKLRSCGIDLKDIVTPSYEILIPNDEPAVQRGLYKVAANLKKTFN